MTIAAYRYKYADWQARVMAFKPEWHYTGHNCKVDLPGDAVIEPMYTQAHVQELEQRCERLQHEANQSEKWKGMCESVVGKVTVEQWSALENVRLLAARHKNEEWAKHMLNFCADAGHIGKTTRDEIGMPKNQGVMDGNITP